MPAGSTWGRAFPRTEDGPLVTGAAAFTEDLPAEGAMWASFVRSTIAHAAIRSIETDQARTMPGVAGVFTGSDLGLKPFGVERGVSKALGRPVLASGRVRF